MAKPDILLMGPPASTNMIPLLEDDFTVHRYWEAEDKPELLRTLAPNLRYVATTGHQGPDANVIQALPNLELIASFGVGYDGIDVDAARAAGIRVTNTPDVLNDCMAEITLGLMLSLVRDLPQADRYVREGRWAHANYPMQDELSGRTAGILGLGRIGKEIARRLQAFRMQVIYHGRNRQPYEPYPFYSSLKEMAEACDWLIVIAPGSDSTRHLVNAEVLRSLGRDGWLVNVGRGSLVDEDALVAALQNKQIRGAALDVFENEPNPHPGLLSLENVVLSPHAGSATNRTRDRMAETVAKNLKAHLRGDPLPNAVV
ncbi:UNVERIFIED_ORG: lactate dehydrogenase-like 2-hydroxyacid dehydrogenase [Martelella mediterranea]